MISQPNLGVVNRYSAVQELQKSVKGPKVKFKSFAKSEANLIQGHKWRENWLNTAI